MKDILIGLLMAISAGVCSATHSNAVDPLAPLHAPPPPPPAPLHPVSETLWGRQVIDNYRYMEPLDASTVAWMKAEGDYTRAILAAIQRRTSLGKRIAALTSSFEFAQGYVRYGGRDFYEERQGGSDQFDLFVKDGVATRKIIDVAAWGSGHGGGAFAINFFFVSPDGGKVAAGLSRNDSEAASIVVIDASTGALLAGPVDRADPGFVAWSVDARRLYFTRLKQVAPGDADTEKYRDASVVSWDLKSEPVELLGSRVGRGPSFLPDETPSLIVTPGASMAMAASFNGVQSEQALWLAPLSRLNDPKLRWTPFVTRADGITAAEAIGNTVFLLSHKDAPTFRVLSVKAGQPLSTARIVLPARPDRVIDSIHGGSDALYALARQGAYSLLLRMPYGTGRTEEVVLPIKGSVREAFTDARRPGITISLESFVVPPTTLSYDPSRKRFSDLRLVARSKEDADRYVISDLQAKAEDGVMIPDTLVQPKSASGPQIVLIQAYGAYGISQLATFGPRAATFLDAGGTYASCHVRGGGELGEAWRLAGKDANKPHTWHDLIACAKDLIARGITTKEKLFILGGSAGGIAVGRAMTERPDLFAGVIMLVPGANTLRDEFQPSGPLNIPEFGTIKTREGFENLFRMDTIAHVQSGIEYPPVLITTGLNDPRVSPWEPAKLAAALLASGTKRPVLLRIDAEAGHGIGASKSQEDALYADMWAFIFWRAGLSGWRPIFNPSK